MKKIILAAAIVLTTGVLTIVSNNSNTQVINKIAKANIAFDKNVLGTAD